jgi:Protein of unknown function (DUF3551)
MRKFGLMMMTVLATGFATFASSVPAKAYDYPWCTQGRSLGYPGDCSYQTYAQCMASASGRALFCGINPRVAFAQDWRARRVYRDPYPQW